MTDVKLMSQALTDLMLPREPSSVLLSMSFLLRKSTSSSKCFKKSAPIMGWEMSAMMKGQEKLRRRPRSSFISFWPYVLIEVPFAANNCMFATGEFFLSIRLGGINVRSDPVSMRNRRLRSLSVIINRLCSVANTSFAANERVATSFFGF